MTRPTTMRRYIVIITMRQYEKRFERTHRKSGDDDDSAVNVVGTLIGRLIITLLLFNIILFYVIHVMT